MDIISHFGSKRHKRILWITKSKIIFFFIYKKILELVELKVYNIETMKDEDVNKLLNDPAFVLRSIDRQIHEARIELNNEIHNIKSYLGLIIVLIIILGVGIFMK